MQLKNMLARLTDAYRRDESSNISKLFSIAANEITEAKTALDTIESFRDIDNAVGGTLDRIGINVNEPRGDKNDVDYRFFIKLRIIINSSGGSITTLNEVMSLLLRDAWIGTQETWNMSGYSNEPAAVAVRYDSELLHAQVEQSYEDTIIDPWSFNGEFFFNGERFFDNRTPQASSTIEARIATVMRLREAAARLIAAGVRVYYELPTEAAVEVEIEQYPSLVLNHEPVNDNDIEQSAVWDMRHVVQNDASNLFDGTHYFDGEVQLDGVRDFTVHYVDVTEVAGP